MCLRAPDSWGGGAELEAQAESMALIRIARSTAT